MKQKKFFFLAAAAGLFAACSESDVAEKQSPQTEPGAVLFDAYTQRGLTRAGQTDIMTTEKLKVSKDNGGGFGVFAYYTDNNEYEQSRIPDYMYNQGVFFESSYWQYAPIKYWPNEYGSNAESDDADKVTFFAYAPYVATTGTGKLIAGETTWGITGMSKNSQAGDPYVKYIASFERTKSVDLLWGIVGEGDELWNQTNGGQLSQQKGYPWLNVTRPAEAATQQTAQQRVKFTFAHATTQLSMNIDAIVDEISKGSNTLAAGTKIYVRQLSMTGVALKGALNLNNTEAGEEGKAVWLDYNGLGEIESGVPVVLYDGRKDGKEGVNGATASNEKIVGFNPDIISNDGNQSPGVTADPQKVFKDDPVMLIPTGEDMELEIIYDVETKDDALATQLSDGSSKGSSIENRVRKTIKFKELNENDWKNGLENGRHYTINLHLGMNSVKFDVSKVETWDESVSFQPDVDLPSNYSSVSGVYNARNATLSDFAAFTGLAYGTNEYKFTVSGLKAGEEITSEVVTDKWIDALNNGGSNANDKASVIVGSTEGGNDNHADANGVAYVTVTLPGNKTVHDLPAGNNYILIEGNESLTGWKARFEQAAHPFDAQVAKLANSTSVTTNDEIDLGFITGSTVNDNSLNVGVNKNAASGADNTLKYGAMYDGSTIDDIENFINVKVNGNALTYCATTTWADGGREYNYDGANKKITIEGNLIVNDVVTIELAARNIATTDDDGAKQTLTFKVGGISFASATESYTFSTSAIDIQQATIVPAGATVSTWGWSKEGSDSFFSFTTNNAAQATVTPSNIGTGTDNNVQAKATFAAPAAGSEYFFTEKSGTATFTLSITALGSTIAFTNATEVITDVPVAAGTIDWTKTKTVKDANNNTISVTDGTEVKYTIMSVSVDGTTTNATDANGDLSVGLFTIANDGALTNAALTLAKNYKVVIRATFTKAGYSTSYADKTITVQTVGE